MVEVKARVGTGQQSSDAPRKDFVFVNRRYGHKPARLYLQIAGSEKVSDLFVRSTRGTSLHQMRYYAVTSRKPEDQLQETYLSCPIRSSNSSLIASVIAALH